MYIFVVKTLVQDEDSTYCTVELFADKEEAAKFAEKEFKEYLDNYQGTIISDAITRKILESQDMYVTINIETHQV